MKKVWLDRTDQKTRPDYPSALNALLKNGEATGVAGVFDGMSAVLAQRAGFEALYLSGAALSASKATPDLGLLTLEEVVRASREIVRASQLPLIVDCDTGFGEALNVMRTVNELEEAGVAGIQIEDQKFPKKCGHLNDKQVISTDDMCRKIAAARKASSTMQICARTDAAFLSLDEAIDRANRYTEAGADIIFVEALTSAEAITDIRSRVPAPLLANMTEFGRTPMTSLSEWDDYGYELVIFPVSAFRVASKAMQDFFINLRASGSAEDSLPKMMTRAELYETIGYFEYEAMDASIALTVLDASAENTKNEE